MAMNAWEAQRFRDLQKEVAALKARCADLEKQLEQKPPRRTKAMASQKED